MHIHTEGACFEGSQTGGVQWWMGCIFCLQTAGLQSGQRGREGHRSTYTLAQVLDLCALEVRMCVHVHPGCYPVSFFWPRFFRWRTPSPILPSHLPRPRLFIPRLPHWQAELSRWWMTVRLVSVSESCSSATLQCGSLSKISCQVSYTLPASVVFLFCPAFWIRHYLSITPPVSGTCSGIKENFQTFFKMVPSFSSKWPCRSKLG